MINTNSETVNIVEPLKIDLNNLTEILLRLPIVKLLLRDSWSVRPTLLLPSLGTEVLISGCEAEISLFLLVLYVVKEIKVKKNERTFIIQNLNWLSRHISKNARLLCFLMFFSFFFVVLQPKESIVVASQSS